MPAANTHLKDFFREELAALRTETLDFSLQHPELARTLGLNAREASDPQVELLLQSFAFLSGRLRYQIAQDKAQLPNALLAALYPHLEAPIPSMLIAEMTAKPDGANFAKEQVLARGRYVLASAMNHMGQKTECRFRTCYETPLLALVIDEIELESAAEYPFLNRVEDAQAVLRIRLRADGVGQLQSKGKGPQRVRFYINDGEAGAFHLYEMLALFLTSVTVMPATPDQTAVLLPGDALRWLGMDEQEAMLESNPHTHPGYRLLQEYFSFPEKYLFFEISQLDQLDFTGIDHYFDLLLVLDMPYDPSIIFSKKNLLLNCVPLINLFSQRIDPLALTHTEYEYHLKGDLKNHRYCEIYAIEALESISSKGSPRPIAPYFAMDNFQHMEQQDYFYVAHRKHAQAPNIAGSEMYVSFLDQQFSLSHLVDEVVAGRALCTNRRLPEKLLSGSPMYLEGAGPVTRICALTKPTPHHATAQIGERPWSLVSQLSLNHLSLSDGPAALSALKDILRLHLGANANHGHRQINAIQNLRQRSIVRHVGQDGWRGFVRGSALTLTLDRAAFDAASPVLFCAVLRHFFRMYASVNHLTELHLETNDIKGIQKQWLPLAGATIAL
jgi:type VI secretion system protein ImpG